MKSLSKGEITVSVEIIGISQANENNSDSAEILYWYQNRKRQQKIVQKIVNPSQK